MNNIQKNNNLDDNFNYTLNAKSYNNTYNNYLENENKDLYKKQMYNNINYNNNSNLDYLNYYIDEQLSYKQKGHTIFKNGILKGIIKIYSEIEKLANKIQQILKKKITFNLIYKAIELGDNANTFHLLCDNLEMSLVIIETTKGIRFGGFTTKSWKGDCINKKDNNAFVFSIDKNKIFDVIFDKDAIGCYPTFGPVFLGCQIRIYNNFFKEGGTTFEKQVTYQTEYDYELNNGERNFIVKDLEVYSINFN